MKKLATILAIFCITIAFAQGQYLTAKTYVERTKVSPKTGLAIGFQSPYGYEIGGFYQTSEIMTNGEAEMPRFYEKEFAGLYLNFLLAEGRKTTLLFNVRTGVINKEYFSITPSVLVNHELFNRFKLGVGVGTRAFRPTLQGSLKIDLY